MAYNLEDEWEKFLNNDNSEIIDNKRIDVTKNNIPKCSDIYISTKTKIAYLNSNINLEKYFGKYLY